MTSALMASILEYIDSDLDFTSFALSLQGPAFTGFSAAAASKAA